MSNAIRFEAGEFGFGLDASTARRQFWLSLSVGLAVLAVAAMIELQPTRAAAPERASRPNPRARIRRLAARRRPTAALDDDRREFERGLAVKICRLVPGAVRRLRGEADLWAGGANFGAPRADNGPT